MVSAVSLSIPVSAGAPALSDAAPQVVAGQMPAAASKAAGATGDAVIWDVGSNLPAIVNGGALTGKAMPAQQDDSSSTITAINGLLGAMAKDISCSQSKASTNSDLLSRLQGYLDQISSLVASVNRHTRDDA